MRLTRIGIMQQGRNLDAFIRAAEGYSEASSSTNLEAQATNTFMEELVDIGAENYFRWFSPFVGSSEANKRLNLFNFHESAALINATVPVSNIKGVSITNDGLSGYNFGIKPSNLTFRDLTQVGIGFYMPVAAQVYTGLPGSQITIITYDGGLCYPYVAGNVGLDYTFAVSDTLKGHWYFERDSSTTVKVYNENVQIRNSAQPDNGFGNPNPAQIRTRAGNGSAAVWACWYMCNKLGAFRTDVHTAVVNYMTNLGRQAA